MPWRKFGSSLLLSLLLVFAAERPSSAQEPPNPPSTEPSSAAAVTSTSPPAQGNDQIAVIAGTRLSLVLRNGINTRSARAGDSVYFETAYPIAANNRIVIPMGTFVRGEILEAKRPGRIHGRGEFRIALEQMTFSNGYLIDLRAVPTSVDHNGQEEVTPGGRVTGPGSGARDVGTVALATAIGGPVGGYSGILAGHPSRGSVAIGHGLGLVAGLAVVLLTRGPEAELPRGTSVDSILERPLLLDAASLPANVGAGVDPLTWNRPIPPDAPRSRREMRERYRRRPPLWPILLRPY